MAESGGSADRRLGQLATEETFLNAYSRRRAGDVYDREVLAIGIGGEIYGIDIVHTREIIKVKPITEVPRTPPFVAGVVTVRGTVIPTIDLRRRLGFAPVTGTRHTRILICEMDGELHGLVVDSVRHVVRLRNAQIEAPPPMGGGSEADFLAGIGRTDDLLLILLDLRAVVSFTIDGAR
jgi:purine-binding chemotaxis protein CheW